MRHISSTGIPGVANTRIAPAGVSWDAIRTDRLLGLQTVDHLGPAAGPVIVEPAAMYFLVHPGASEGWSVPQSTAIGQTQHVVLPPETKSPPPGPYWLLSPTLPLASAAALRRALEAVQGPRPGSPDLDRLTMNQIMGWNCALCGVRLYADRSLGKFRTGSGMLTEETELWACAGFRSPRNRRRE
ncbi:hypothetical protein [Streptomyces sp. NPDC049916]|uniref:hypothetical protein n=1 Tax=Streptomyces sp. NPDC049916 TaxID=3155156 RepID=UPI0034239AE5